ncbi:MAG: hypothetical protein HUK03_03260 [Bacteroidaceae bacterium]|nr:hypothetical protein [Bacteroidaceae bacterium]
MVGLIKRAKWLLIILCLWVSTPSFAQYMDDEDLDEDWGMYLEDEDERPQHTIYNNYFYAHFSPSRYHVDDASIRFKEVSVGYFRALQIVEDNYYFVEIGANAKYSWATTEDTKYNMLTLRVPISAMYKIHLCKTNDLALAPYAGVYFRAIVAGRPSGWDACQLGWHTGVRIYWDRYYLAASYSRDFPDNTKKPSLHECGVHFGVGF